MDDATLHDIMFDFGAAEVANVHDRFAAGPRGNRGLFLGSRLKAWDNLCWSKCPSNLVALDGQRFHDS